MLGRVVREVVVVVVIIAFFVVRVGRLLAAGQKGSWYAAQ